MFLLFLEMYYLCLSIKAHLYRNLRQCTRWIKWTGGSKKLALNVLDSFISNTLTKEMTVKFFKTCANQANFACINPSWILFQDYLTNSHFHVHNIKTCQIKFSPIKTQKIKVSLNMSISREQDNNSNVETRLIETKRVGNSLHATRYGRNWRWLLKRVSWVNTKTTDVYS